MSSLTQIEAQLVEAIGRLQRHPDLTAAEWLKLRSLSNNLASVRAAIEGPKASAATRLRANIQQSHGDA